MIDPIKKQIELQSLTEGIFENLFSRTKALPSVAQSNAIKSYRDKHEVYYLIDDVALRNKKFSAMELIKLLSDGSIDGDTKLKQVGVKKGVWFPFENLLKYEPYKTALEKSRGNNENPGKINDKLYIYFSNFVPTNMLNKSFYQSISELAEFIKSNPQAEDWTKIWEDKKWIDLKKSSIYPDFQNWLNYHNSRP